MINVKFRKYIYALVGDKSFYSVLIVQKCRISAKSSSY